MAEMQTIPARHAVATFVPAGHSIKIINSSGNQVIDTWAFALPEPEPKSKEKDEEDQQEGKEEKLAREKIQQASKRNPKTADLPDQDEAEKATRVNISSDNDQKEQQDETAQKSGWSSYIPSVPTLGLTSKSKDDGDKGKDDGEQRPRKGETKQQANSRTWSSYMPSGKGFSSYIPKTATDTVTSFAKDHQRDPSKSYWQQLQDFSKTPVGAAGLAVATGSGYKGSIYAGYQAWNAFNANDRADTEFLSMAQSRTATLHLCPRVDDTLVSNLREPMLTLIADTSPGVHDTLIAACDPLRYKHMNVTEWEKHGSCAENLVLALKELNERAGLKGAKAIGADVTINSVPAPLNLFMNIPWDSDGDLTFKAPKSKKGDYVRFKAERDVVIVMSACPNDVNGVNGGRPSDAQFIVEEDEEDVKTALKRTAAAPKKRSPPKKIPPQTKAPEVEETVPAPAASAAVRKKAPPAPVAKKTTAQNGSAPKPAVSNNGPVSAPRKKPVPRPVAPQKKPVPTQPSLGADTENDPVPVQKKKPRKLAPKAA